jgi:hypothetical protein
VRQDVFMTVDWWARGLGIAGILIGLASPTAGYFVWRRSGSRVKVHLYPVAINANRLEDVVRIEIQVMGLQPAMIQRIQLGQRVPTEVVSTHQQYEILWFFDAEPTDGREPLGRLVQPTDRVIADVPIVEVASLLDGTNYEFHYKQESPEETGLCDSPS